MFAINFIPGPTFSTQLLLLTSTSIFQLGCGSGLKDHRISAQQQALLVSGKFNRHRQCIECTKKIENLTSSTFKTLPQQLTKYKPLIVFGLIEQDDGNLFNTAVVIKDGELLGRYRKTHLLEGEQIFKAGSEYPVFQINGLKFGINICYDTQFPEAAKNVAKQGATLILCPANNMMTYETAEKFKHLHHKMRIERATETKVWLLSADVTGEHNGRISYGPTSAISPAGQVVKQVGLMETGMITIEI